MSFVELIPSDSETSVQVSLLVARMSTTISNMLEDIGADSPVPLHNVSSNILSLVVKYCEYHVENPEPPKDEESKEKTTEVSPWDKEFLSVDQSVLFELILAANFLDIKPLLDATCKTVANMIKGKSPEEIRKQFNIVNDFTPEEEEKIRKENEWCEAN
jgi:S-phase kinase-associated protein 1